jgi:hypothetical protein
MNPMTICPAERDVTAAAGAPRRSIALHGLLAGLIALHLVLIWSFPWVPTQDGPAHVEGARIIRDHLAGDPHVQHYYDLRWELLPNMIDHVVMAELMVVLSPSAAAKVWISGFVILLPLAMLYAARSIRRSREADFVALLATPFSLNFLLHMGFFNFNYGVALSLLALGFYLRHRERFGWWHAAGLMGLSVLTFITHLLPVLFLGLSIGASAVLMPLMAWWRTGERPKWMPVVVPLAALVPAGLLVLPYLLGGGEGITGGGTRKSGLSLYESAERLAGWQMLASFDRYETYVALAFAGLVAVVVIAGLWGRVRHRESASLAGDVVGVLVLLYAGLYFLRRDGLAVALWLPERTSLYLHLLLLVWLAGQPLGRRLRMLAGAGGAAVAIALLAIHTNTYWRINAEMRDVATAAEQVRPSSTVLSLVYDNHGRDADGQPLSFKVMPMPFFPSQLAAERRYLDLANYQGHTTHFPMRWKPELNPRKHLGRMRSGGDHELEVNLLNYRKATGNAADVDYVLIYGLAKEDAALPQTAALLEQLQQGYRLIHTSPRGHTTLYERRGADPTPP